jgi:hypothetical protein
VEDKLELYTIHRNIEPLEVWRLVVRDTKRPKEDHKAKLPAKMFSFDHLFLFIVVNKEEIHPLNFWLSRTKTLSIRYLPDPLFRNAIYPLLYLTSSIPFHYNPRHFTTTPPAKRCSTSSR